MVSCELSNSASRGFPRRSLRSALGVGGGVIIVPLLNFSGFSFQASVAASPFSIVIISRISVLTRDRAVLRYARYTAAPAAAAILASILSVKYGRPIVEKLYGISPLDSYLDVPLAEGRTP